MQPFAKFKNILQRGFRATLNFRKIKVALNPLRRIIVNFAKSDTPVLLIGESLWIRWISLSLVYLSKTGILDFHTDVVILKRSMHVYKQCVEVCLNGLSEQLVTDQRHHNLSLLHSRFFGMSRNTPPKPVILSIHFFGKCRKKENVTTPIAVELCHYYRFVLLWICNTV